MWKNVSVKPRRPITVFKVDFRLLGQVLWRLQIYPSFLFPLESIWNFFFYFLESDQ